MLGGFGRVEEVHRRAAIDADLRRMFKKKGDNLQFSVVEFVSFCEHVLGKTKRVVVKFILREVQSHSSARPHT